MKSRAKEGDQYTALSGVKHSFRARGSELSTMF
jgi:hypothetical protein